MPECEYCHQAVEDVSQPCPHCGYGGEKSEVGDIRLTRPQRIAGRQAGPGMPRDTRPQGREGGRPGSQGADKGKQDVRPFRPLYRPPMLLVCLLDDDGADGEWIRVRGDRFVIGRTEGDYQVSHEAGMSSAHLELMREFKDGEHFWHVRDLDTTNGTFALVDNARLRNHQQLLVGSRRYRFDAASQGSGSVSSQEPPTGRGATQAWHVIASAASRPKLVHLTRESGEDGEEYPLDTDEQWIGTDGRLCQLAIQDDPFLDPRHAKIFQERRERWRIEDGGSTNGTWVSIRRLRIETSARLQVGEQRFELRVP